MLVEFDNARVLVTDMKIEAIKDIIPILEQISRLNQPLLIIAVRDIIAPVTAAHCILLSVAVTVPLASAQEGSHQLASTACLPCSN